MLVESRLTVKPQSDKVICQTLESISIIGKNMADLFKSPNFGSKIDNLFSGRRVISLLISDS